MEQQELINFVENNKLLKDKVEYVESDTQIHCVFYTNSTIFDEPQNFFGLNRDVYEMVPLSGCFGHLTENNIGAVKIIIRNIIGNEMMIDVEYMPYEINKVQNFVDEAYTNEVVEGLKELFFTLKLLGYTPKY